MTAARDGMRLRLGRRQSRRKIQGPALGPPSPSAPPPSPLDQELRLQGHLLFEPELCDVPPEDAGSAPSPHRSAPTSLSHTRQGGSTHSERWSQRGLRGWACTSPPTPTALSPYPLPLLLSFHDGTSRHCPDTPSAPPAACFSAS